MGALEDARRDYPNVDWDARLVRHDRFIEVAALKDAEPIHGCMIQLESAAKKDALPDDLIAEAVGEIMAAMRAKGLYPPA